MKLYRPITTNTFFFFFGIELVQMKLDELVEDVMDLDINKESVDDNRGHTHDHVCYSLKVHQGLECL